MDEALGDRVALHVTQGYTVKLDTGSLVILSKTVKVNHILHAILSILTIPMFAFWIIVWIIMALRRAEETIQLKIQDGKIQEQHLGKQRKP
ncbi:MAG: hypothetical protein CL760_07585 [Chloroflexi bacterium]|nr:hypothetical protein [Chloroflexota bacterium]